MDRDPNLEDPNRFPQTYGNLVNLWTSAVRDYHSLLSDYLLANSIFVAAIGYILARHPPTFLFTCLGMILCVFGILMVVQMAIVLGRFSAQIALWECMSGDARLSPRPTTSARRIARTLAVNTVPTPLIVASQQK